VLPVAGLGTRFLPATKQMAKEMLPVVDKPLIQYAVEEARAAGIEQFCFVTGRGKTMLVDQFDVAYELERTLTERNKAKELAMLQAQALPPGSIVSTRQQVPLGLGHAIWCARAFIADEPFAILLPDDLMLCETSCTKQLADAYMATGGNVVAIEEVPMARVSSYGVIAPGATTGNLVEVTGLVGKAAGGQGTVQPDGDRALRADAGGDRPPVEDGTRRRQRDPAHRQHGEADRHAALPRRPLRGPPLRLRRQGRLPGRPRWPSRCRATTWRPRCAPSSKNTPERRAGSAAPDDSLPPRLRRDLAARIRHPRDRRPDAAPRGRLCHRPLLRHDG
jgi:hypothetical protein